MKKIKATVIQSTGSWYEVLDEDKKRWKCRLRGIFKKDQQKLSNPVVVGDFVIMMPENSEIGIITEILPRQNYIARKSVHHSQQSHLLASNISQLAILATWVYPRTSLGFIDRLLVTAETFRIPTYLIFNKIDLLTAEEQETLDEIQKIYTDLGYEFLRVSVEKKQNTETLLPIFNHQTTLICGHSGVGKSSLLNFLNPLLDIKTKKISNFAQKGVHTTTFATMYVLDENTFIIDTPGIKELGIDEVDNSELSHYFPEMRALLNECKYQNCQHVNEPECAVIKAVETEKIHASRYKSYLSMLENDDNRR